MILFQLGEVKIEIAETNTLVLRGGAEFKVRRVEYTPEGLGKMITYFEGRYLRDGAKSSADYPITEALLPKWREFCTEAGEGFECKEEKGKTPIITVKAKPLTKWTEKPTRESLPDGVSSVEFIKAINATLDKHAEEHAEARSGALYSGDIPDGKAGGGQPELPHLRGYCATIIAEQHGFKKAVAVKKVRVSNTVSDLREWFTGDADVTAPKRLKGDAGVWFDELHGKATALIEFERTQRNSITE